MSSATTNEADTVILKPGPKVVASDINKIISPKQSKHAFTMDNSANNNELHNITNYVNKFNFNNKLSNVINSKTLNLCK